MIRYVGTFALAAVLMAPIACDKPGVEEQQKEQKAVQDNADQQQRAAHESASAQQDMNNRVATAQADFDRARDDYRRDKQQDIDSLDAKIASLETKERTATGKVKADLDAKLPAIRAERASFGADFRGLQATTAASWDDAKARVDKEWEDLKGAVNDAS
jgi:hypothetical protein